MKKKRLKPELKIEFQNLKNNPVAKFAHRVNALSFSVTEPFIHAKASRKTASLLSLTVSKQSIRKGLFLSGNQINALVK